MIEEILQKPCWVIDFLPSQVPADSNGQFFAVERYYLQAPRQETLRRRFAQILLQLNCYADLMVCRPEEENWQRNPDPEELASRITENQTDLCILLPRENALLTLNRDDLCMAVYNPSEQLLACLESLASAAGLFLWQPPRKEETP